MAIHESLGLEAAMVISILKHQTKISWIQMKKDLSLLKKLLMPQLGESVECYVLESKLGSSKRRHCQKLQGLLEEEITVCSLWLFLFLSQAKHC